MNQKSDKHTTSFQKEKLRDGEVIECHLKGWIGEMMGKGDNTQQNGQFILTNKRACFYRKGFLGEVFETIPLEKISSVETLTRMGYRVLRCHTNNDELTFKTFEAKDLFDTTYNRLEELRHMKPNSTSTQPPPISISDEILRLAKMKEDGLISGQEFDALKEKLINS